MQRINKEFIVNDVNQAFELSLKFAQEGKYQWFRGQRKDWPLVSSYLRLSEEERIKADSRIGLFIEWVNKTPGLEYALQSRDAIYSIAQHYGLKTNYIDFTTDPTVAAFFSMDGKQEDDEACIVCLNIDDFIEYWKNNIKEYPPPELIEINVSNLWRLQAQKGKFLLCPYRDIERIYPFDRILFCSGLEYSKKQKSEIYPSRKSQLELLLDQYFDIERGIAFNETISTMNFRKVGFATTEMYSPDMICGDKILIEHNSWNDENLAPWLKHMDEMLVKAESNIIWRFNIDVRITPELIRKQMTEFVLDMITNTTDARRKLIKWVVPLNNLKNRELKIDVGWLTQTLWDGLRLLPYSNEDIAEGFGLFACLVYWFTQEETDNDTSIRSLCSRALKDEIEVDFGAADGSGARTFVSETTLREAVREDILNYIAEFEYAESMTLLMQAIWSPRHLFDFNKLSKVWATQIAPTQVLKYKTKNVIFYSPARLKTFGRP
jgi:hypothetical protein